MISLPKPISELREELAKAQECEGQILASIEKKREQLSRAQRGICELKKRIARGEAEEANP